MRVKKQIKRGKFQPKLKCINLDFFLSWFFVKDTEDSQDNTRRETTILFLITTSAHSKNLENLSCGLYVRCIPCNCETSACMQYFYNNQTFDKKFTHLRQSQLDIQYFRVHTATSWISSQFFQNHFIL